MGEFESDWLALREAADVLARSSRLTRAIADRFPEDAELLVLDIATGTGANVRYLAEHLPPRQSWVLVDRDPVLLAELPMCMRSWGVPRGLEIAGEGDSLLVTGARLMCRLARSRRDLATDMEGGDGDIFAGRNLVTASALLDLVSERWLRAFASRCRHSCAAVLLALTYDGRIRCSPEEPEDETIRALVNAHQQTDKGFGAALGATANSASPASAITCNAGRATGCWGPTRASCRSNSSTGGRRRRSLSGLGSRHQSEAGGRGGSRT